MKKSLLAVALALSVTGCSSGGMSWWTSSYGKTFPEPNEGMAAVYIVRDDSGADQPPLDLTISRAQVASLRAMNWVRLDLPPNPYDFRAYGTQESMELIVTVSAGQTRFLRADPKAPDTAQLAEIGWADGRELVRKGQQVYSYWR